MVSDYYRNYQDSPNATLRAEKNPKKNPPKKFQKNFQKNFQKKKIQKKFSKKIFKKNFQIKNCLNSYACNRVSACENFWDLGPLV
jgi:hypothetical protein